MAIYVDTQTEGISYPYLTPFTTGKGLLDSVDGREQLVDPVSRKGGGRSDRGSAARLRPVGAVRQPRQRLEARHYRSLSQPAWAEQLPVRRPRLEGTVATDLGARGPAVSSVEAPRCLADDEAATDGKVSRSAHGAIRRPHCIETSIVASGRSVDCLSSADAPIVSVIISEGCT